MERELYNLEYFTSHTGDLEQIHWDNGQLRCGNQLAAIGYSFGYQSFPEIRKDFGFEGNGDQLQYGLSARDQLERLVPKRYPLPDTCVEIGGGRGEVSCAMTYLGVDVQMIEASPFAARLIDMTVKRFDLPWPYIVIDKPLGEAMSLIDWSDVDTVIMVETLEHIREGEFIHAFPLIKKSLTRNHGLFIITNWIDFWPIEIALPYHIWRIDDHVYDTICEDGEVIYREGSHLVVKYE